MFEVVARHHADINYVHNPETTHFIIFIKHLISTDWVHAINVKFII